MMIINLYYYLIDSGSNSESGPNSPPTGNNSQASPTAGSNTPIQEVIYLIDKINFINCYLYILT